jgi:hypothetical protein
VSSFAVIRRKENYPEFIDTVIEVKQFKLTNQEPGLLSWGLTGGSAGTAVQLPGWDSADEHALSRMSQLPVGTAD